MILAFLFLTGCSEEAKVKNACKGYMNARIALRSGDTSRLKEVTVDSLYMLEMLHYQYLKLIDAPVIHADLNLNPKEVEVKDNHASCLMSGGEYYKIHLCKMNGKWLVEGENEHFDFSKDILAARKKLEDQKIFLKEKPMQDSVFRVLDLFYAGVKKYFIKHGEHDLKRTCNEATLDMIQRLYKYSIKRTGREIILKELDKPKFITFDVNLSRDQIICKFYKDAPEIILQKSGDSYIVTGMNGMDSKEITDKVIEREYPMLLRGLKIISAKADEDKIGF